MKVIDIVGENYFGKWDKTRTACRGIIIHDTKVHEGGKRLYR